MNFYAVCAGGLAIGVSLIHSVLGEKLVFSRMRNGGLVPTNGQPVLRERHVRILWATWHLVSIMGIAFGVLLIQAGQAGSATLEPRFVFNTIISTMSAGAVLVMFATKGRHPGWLGLLGVAALTWLYTLG